MTEPENTQPLPRDEALRAKGEFTETDFGDRENLIEGGEGEYTDSNLGTTDDDVPAGVQSVDEGLPNDELPDDETIVRDTRSE
ncbi:hypothetical protein [Agromyces sp. PvR057]|uniref:hypothetical protein n=1 Tax=Agromyces sp. PvR057 TaxID=3156403 RepID=UPI0033983206